MSRVPIAAICRPSRLLAAALLLAACGGKAGGTKQKGEGKPAAASRPRADLSVDVSTPDRALRSRWKLQDMTRDVGVPMDSTRESDRLFYAWHRAQLALLTGDAKTAAEMEENAPRSVYHREILAVQQETESRAVILARVRNATKVPEGAVVTDYAAERRGEGELYRYVYEKDAAGWKLAQVYARYPGEAAWHEYYSTEPVVPTWTYP